MFARSGYLRLLALGICATVLSPAKASHDPTAFDVDFTSCVESVGVGLAPTANVVALTPPPFIPVGLGTPVSPVVVRTADPASALGQLIGGATMPFVVIQQFNLLPAATMQVRVAP